ncbi:polysaccharide deacetylase [Vibrio diazotrophicus]|uniref:Polysaccharide deacetylase n=1 Tax=Vibrio diazotrophicus TaxID=685 RepID=A0A2J8I1G2_VIBDI|nr:MULTISPECIES: polysaccharide deacetylase family protein [Vibrio]MCF7363451.1 polysaccharide deacetylase family protein [Vibrio sp. A1-b2]PNI04348.1 polysaccharide deacetylase [Vibrio diazotrophicus]
MNILMALSQLEVTGAEVYATTVGDELTKRGHNVVYVSDTLTKPHLGPFFSLRFNKRSIPRRFWHVAYLVYLIRKNNIQLIHAHSRASSWSCHIACKITGTPMVTTVHGRQPVHASRKKFHAMGDKTLPVCEAIRDQLHKDLTVPLDEMVISRNGIQTSYFKWQDAPENTKPIITIIGRLTGPKGDLCYKLLQDCLDTEKYDVRVITGSEVTDRFTPFTSKVTFPGYTNDVQQVMAQSDLVIGAGRVAMEALLCGRPTLAIGEASCIGLVDSNNIHQAMATNFGDIGSKDLDIDFSQIADIVEAALKTKHCETEVNQLIQDNYDLAKVVDHLEDTYQTVYVEKLQREMPVIMYHRFIRDESEKGVHGTYMHVDMLEKHFKLLKRMGFETLTFSDLADKRLIHRLEYGKRYIILTVDDGYKDNHELLLPLLKKYHFKAVIYVVTGENFNRWDVEVPENPEKSVPLMSAEQLKELHSSGLVEIGGHTMTHPRLSTLSEAEQRTQIETNKQELEELLQTKLCSFAYPYGDHNQCSKDIAQQAGYQFAVATNSGPLAMHQDKYQIRRIAIFPKTDVFGLWRKIRGNYTFRKVKK